MINLLIKAKVVQKLCRFTATLCLSKCCRPHHLDMSTPNKRGRAEHHADIQGQLECCDFHW